MSEIAEVIIKDYRKNIKIRDVKLKTAFIWDTLILKITDNNKKHFKNKTIGDDVFFDEARGLEYYIEALIKDYIECKIGRKIRELEAYDAIQKYKKEFKDDERTLY